MSPALISLHRQGVFRQPWFILTSLTSDSSLSLVDYFPLIPKVHKMPVISVAIHTFRNNYPSAVDNRFICSLLDKDFCAVKKKNKKTKNKKKQKKKKNKKKKQKQTNFKTQHEFSERCSKPNTEYTRCPEGWLGEAKVSCILRHRGVQMIFAYSWAKSAILAAGKGRGGMFFISSVSSLSLIFPFSRVHLFHLLYYLSSPFLWDDTK